MTKAETVILKALKEIAKMINSCEAIEIPTVKIPPKSSIDAASVIIESAIEAGMGGMDDVELFPDEILETANAVSDEIAEYKKSSEDESPKNDSITDAEIIEVAPVEGENPQLDSENPDPFASQENQSNEPASKVEKKKRGPKKNSAKKPDKNEKDRLIATLFALLPSAQVDNLKSDDMRGILKAML